MEEMLLLNIANANPALEPTRNSSTIPIWRHGLSESIRLAGRFLCQAARALVLRGAGTGETLYEMLIAPVEGLALLARRPAAISCWINGASFSGRISSHASSAPWILSARRSSATPATAASAAPRPCPTFGGEPEYERYSPDQDWMPRLVLIAKNYIRLARPAFAQVSTLDPNARPDPR